MVREKGPDGLASAATEDSFGALAPQVEDLLRRIAGAVPASRTVDGSGMRMEAPITFSDGVGTGVVVAELFNYRDDVRLDIRIEHDRVFAKADGEPTDRRCFLNDYVASKVLDTEFMELPRDFVRKVIAGVSAARDAVRRHNRLARGPWDEVRVAAASG